MQHTTPKFYPAKANRLRLNIGLRGEHSLSPSLSGTSKSSLPFNDERLLLLGVIIGGGELVATSTSDSIAVKAASLISSLSSTRDGVSGMTGSCIVVELCSSGDSEGAHASVFRLRTGEFRMRGVRGQSGGGGLYANLERSSSICEPIAELKTDSGSGLPNELAGVSDAALSWDCSILPLEDTVDCDSLLMLDCTLSEKTLIFFFGCEADSSRSAASNIAS